MIKYLTTSHNHVNHGKTMVNHVKCQQKTLEFNVATEG